MSNFRRFYVFVFIFCLFVLVGYGTGSRVYQGVVLQAQSSTCPPSCDWTQAGSDSQRSGYIPESVGSVIQIKWRHAFQPDKVYPKVQAIVYKANDGISRVYVGTEGANGIAPTLWSFNATTGGVSWKKQVGGSILGSVAAFQNTVFVSSMDGVVYALQAENGTEVWKRKLESGTGS